jgi:hypothetical protein
MLEKIKDFVHHGVHVSLYEGLQPIFVGTERRLIFERHVLIDDKEADALQRNGPVEEWAQKVREEIDRGFNGRIPYKAVRH